SGDRHQCDHERLLPRQKVPVRAYEVRTGRQLANVGLQIGAASCRPTTSYETYGADIGPSPHYVESSTEEIPGRVQDRDRPLRSSLDSGLMQSRFCARV